MVFMKKIFLPMMFFALLNAGGPFDTPCDKDFDFSAFNTKPNEENAKASENKKVVCRTVCDKKLYKEQVIGDAIGYYKNSKKYKFKKKTSKKKPFIKYYIY